MLNLHQSLKRGIYIIKNLFKTFCEHNPHLALEQSVEYFSILGGAEDQIEIDFFDDIFSMVESNFVQNFSKFQMLVSPS